MKYNIVHIAFDSTFIDYTIEQFKIIDNVKCSYFINSKTEVKFIKNIDLIKIIDLEDSDHFNSILTIINKCDIVFFHCLNNDFAKLILKCSTNVKIVWMLWGAEVYGLSEFARNIYQRETKKVLRQIGEMRLKSNLYYKFPSLYYKLYKLKNNQDHRDIDIRKSLNRVDFCATKRDGETELINKTLKLGLKRVKLGYSIKQQLINYNGVVNGNNIQIGNSANPTNNHLDVFIKLKKFDLENRKVICPLSYGSNSKKYVDKVVELGVYYFGKNFYPLLDLLPLKDYNEIVNSCSNVIMNHNRQQAGGNIVNAVYNGASVYMNETSPIYLQYLRRGIKIYSIQTEFNCIFTSHLSKDEISNNRNILIGNFSTERQQRQILVEINKILSS